MYSIWRAADNHQLTGDLLDLWIGPCVGYGDNAAQHHYILHSFFSAEDEGLDAGSVRSESDCPVSLNYLI